MPMHFSEFFLKVNSVTHNYPSARVAEKCSYKREGVLKSYLKVGDKFYDAFVYGKIIR
jgi:ribosomal-protein-alanine N-acetyltransferase